MLQARTFVTQSFIVLQIHYEMFSECSYKMIKKNLVWDDGAVKNVCDEWVLSASVCVARSPVDFCSATTEAERRPLVVSVPIPLRTQ